MEKWLAFLDEAGNTGPNYLDPAQPFYILAGWMVSESKQQQAESAIGAVKSQGKELHGKTFLKHFKAQMATLNMVTMLMQLGCIPVYAIAEKRYCVAAKMVETLLDPAYNRRSRNAITWHTGMKQELADILYRLPAEVLHKFANSYRDMDHGKMEEALHLIVAWLQKQGLADLAVMMEGAFENLEENVRTEQAGQAMIPAGNTLNVPVFVAVMNMIEGVARDEEATEVVLLHDESKHIAGYRDSFEMYRNAVKANITLPNEATMFFGLERITSLSEGRSDDSLFLQASDLLASAIYIYCSELRAGKNPHKPFVEIAGRLLPILRTSANRQVTFIGSDSCLRTIFAPIRSKR